MKLKFFTEQTMEDKVEYLKTIIKAVPDFPQKGILFRDITPMLEDPKGLAYMIDLFAERYEGQKLDAIVGLESRGFVIAAPLAIRLGVGCVLIRKKGKLPRETHQQSYGKEYGTDVMEIHKDSLKKGARVIIVDDLIATGGTLAAGCLLCEKIGAEVVETACLIELPELKGREHADLKKFNVYTMISY